MNSLFLLFKRDLALGFNKITKVFTVLFMIGLFNFLYPLYFLHANIPDSSIAFWDIIGKTFLGVPFELVQQHTFEFPFGWLLFQLSGAILINTYIKDDLFAHSAFVRIRAKSIFKLWVSKLLFSCTAIIVFYISLLSLTWVVWKLSGGTARELTAYGESILRYSSFRLSYSQILTYSIVLNISGTFLITFIFAFFSLIFKTIYSFVICNCILFLSIFSDNPILIGNESMLIRHPIFGSSPVLSISISLVIVLTFCLTLLIGGGLYLSKCELISDKEME
ncbi:MULTISPECIES: hypothetical protein [Bacillus]|uniref:Uncharacterized protein n=1 Tax=Bacillus rugosus TaxID=2715209 RepID=A0ACD3ZYW5_9BACI|nr:MULTISPECIES: hypothetical protein [Bacillus]MBY4603117.1 hypothetical protein [Bacillus sp. SPARC3]NUF07713.1 hypothetical protein [Bacillus rugosus]UPV79190.1 hypothetical protein M0696_20795 [Bacillus rugosus]